MRLPRLPGMKAPKVRSPEVLARGKRLRRFKTRQRIKRGAIEAGLFTASWLLDWWSGFDLDMYRERQKGKLGIFGGALGQGVAGVDTGALPTMEEPQRVSKVNNPTIATISKQLDTLVKTANKIGLQTKQQQDALLNQMAQARRVAKEQQLEQKGPSIPELPTGMESSTTDSLAPLDSSAKELTDKIDELTRTLDQNNGGGGGILDSLLNGLGLASLFGGKGRGRGARAATRVATRAARPTVNLGGQVLEKTGNRWQVVTTAANGSRGYSFASRELAEQAERRLASRSANPVMRALSFASRMGRVAAAPVVAAGSMSLKMAGLLGNTFKNAARKTIAATAVKDAVKRAAGPIITRALGKTALKSIPLLGIGAGLAFAIGRLVQGDPVGAGLDLASGLGGPITAIPALAASVSRDVYSSVYGVQPEQDPEFTPRMATIKAAVEEMIREQLGASVEPKRTPTGQEIANAETPPAAPQRVSGTPPSPPASSSPPSGPPSSTGSTGSRLSASASPSAASTPAPAAATPAPSETGTGQQLAEASAMPESTGQLTGQFLNAQALPADDSWRQYGYSPNMTRFMPQQGQTSRGGAQGVGNIPDPVYYADNLEDLKTTLFFQYG